MQNEPRIQNRRFRSHAPFMEKHHPLLPSRFSSHVLHSDPRHSRPAPFTSSTTLASPINYVRSILKTPNSGPGPLGSLPPLIDDRNVESRPLSLQRHPIQRLPLRDVMHWVCGMNSIPVLTAPPHETQIHLIRIMIKSRQIHHYFGVDGRFPHYRSSAQNTSFVINDERVGQKDRFFLFLPNGWRERRDWQTPDMDNWVTVQRVHPSSSIYAD